MGVVPRPGDRAQCGLANEARQYPPTPRGALGGNRELRGVEANECCERTARRHAGGGPRNETGRRAPIP